ncbi:antirestriction protein ArdA [Nocardia sp. NPDC051929]|uniref:antirestriction protein ArdA n=1 Tax=Nocardia sp. NPDC051929 TaxID=3364327 RepID=UPI0037C70C9C
MNEKYPQHIPAAEDGQEHQPAADERAADREGEPRPHPRIYITKGLPLRAELTTGTWLDMARDPRDIYAEMYGILEDETSDGERLYIWDYRDFGAFDVTTGAIGLEGVDSIELLSQIARGIAKYGPAYAAWADAHDDDPLLFDHFATAYKGHHENMAAYVRQLLEPLRIDEMLKRAVPTALEEFVYVDYAAIGQEMLREGDLVAIPAEGGGVWVFDERA